MFDCSSFSAKLVVSREHYKHMRELAEAKNAWLKKDERVLKCNRYLLVRADCTTERREN